MRVYFIPQTISSLGIFCLYIKHIEVMIVEWCRGCGKVFHTHRKYFIPEEQCYTYYYFHSVKIYPIMLKSVKKSIILTKKC